jgi:capsular exopolysaccharide synthesis family protein
MATKPNTNRRYIITHENPKSPISEAYRTLRTNIDFSAVDEQLRTLMVTSSGPGEGKSTTVANLATVYAQSHRKVIILDADLRKPTMHHTMQVSNRKGLTTFLSGQDTLEDVITKTSIPGVDIIASGPIPPNPSEILASKKLLGLIDTLKEQYDMIIFDTPPALAVTDAQIMATKVDGVILVVDQGRVKKEAAAKMKASLDHVNAHILGVVLNNVDRKTGDNYYYYYYYGNKE